MYQYDDRDDTALPLDFNRDRTRRSILSPERPDFDRRTGRFEVSEDTLAELEPYRYLGIKQ